MPRFAFTPTEEALLTRALVREALARGLALEGPALLAAANTTQAELRALVQTQLTQMRALNTTQLAAADADNVARKAALTAEIATIDSALAKL